MIRSPDDPAVRRFISRSTTVRIATLSPAGNPDIIPLWFVSYRGRLYLSTRSENPTVRDLLRNPEVALLFHGERGRHRGRVLRARARAAFRANRSLTLPAMILAALKYLLRPGGIRNGFLNRDKLSLRGRYVEERTGEVGVIELVLESGEFLKLP